MIHSREQTDTRKTSVDRDTLNEPLQKAVQTKSIAPPDSGINFTVQRERIDLSDGIAQLKTVKPAGGDLQTVVQLKGDPPVINKRGKKTVLIGTQHGVSGKDVSDKVPHDLKQNAAVILEYPPLAGTGETAFGESTIGKIQDKTQASLARESAANKDTHNLEIIGADPRKAFKDGELHSIGIKYKIQGKDYLINAQHVHPGSLFSSIINKYTNLCLALSGGSVDAITSRIRSIILYTDGTDLAYVMKSSYDRINTLAATLPKDRRKSIARKVISAFNQNLNTTMDDYRSKKNSYRKHGFLPQLVEETNDNLVSVLYDSLANLLLYTEVLASSKPNIIVAFGSEHLAPLQQLLNETWAKARRKKRKKRKR